jgi:hypothetical protein
MARHIYARSWFVTHTYLGHWETGTPLLPMHLGSAQVLFSGDYVTFLKTHNPKVEPTE